MYSISDSGKAVAGQLLKVMDDVQWNGFSYSEEFNGFLFIRDAIASNFKLLMELLMDLKPSSMLNVLMMQQFVDHMPRFIWVEIFSRFPSLTIFKRHDHFM